MSGRPVALVTGASRGIGRAIAAGFARGGYDVAIHYHSSEPGARETAALVATAGGKPLLLQADVRKSSDVDAMMKRLESEWGSLDVLVNNAGLASNRTIAKMTDDEWHQVIEGNLDGTFFCTRAALPIMRRKRAGAILSVSSYAAARGLAGAANYAAAKAGIEAFSRSLALEEAPHGIRANVILPGYHVTDLNREYWTKHEDAIRGQHLLRKMPDRDELADFVVKIAGLTSVTGQVFAFESRIL